MSASNDSMCTFETKRKGAPTSTSLSYTIEQAKQAGLLSVHVAAGSRPTGTRCRSRCSGPAPSRELARLEYPDLLAGLYTPEELRDAKVEVCA